MEIKRLVSKYVYHIEPKPEGGFIARASDPNVPSIEAATREELQKKIQSTILAGLGADFPGLQAHTGELKFAFHVEKQPDGTFDIHSSDPASGPLNAANHDQVESHFAEKLISFVGKHMLQDAPEALRRQLASGDVKVFINKTSGFTITTKHDRDPKEFGSLAQLFGGQSDSRAVTAGNSGNSGNIPSNSQSTFGNAAIDSSPITPVNEGAGRFLRILLVLAILAAVMFFLLRRH